MISIVQTVQLSVATAGKPPRYRIGEFVRIELDARYLDIKPDMPFPLPLHPAGQTLCGASIVLCPHKRCEELSVPRDGS